MKKVFIIKNLINDDYLCINDKDIYFRKSILSSYKFDSINEIEIFTKLKYVSLKNMYLSIITLYI